MAIERLFNTGIGVIGDTSKFAADEKTLIVIGPARGGTSLVAGALSHLGVFTGSFSRAPVFEDRRLAEAAEAGDEALVRKIMREYDSQHPTWAYKRPAMIDNFGIIHRNARNPIYLFIFKDLFSMANRNSISMQLDVVKGLRLAQSSFAKVLGFIENIEPTGMLLSYERAVGNKEAFVDSLAELVPGDVSPVARQSAIDFITPNPAEYLEASRITRAAGSVERLSASLVAGLTSYVAAPARAVNVELHVDGVHRSTHAARALDDGSGFRFEIEIEPALKPGQSVALKASDDIRPFVDAVWSPTAD